MINDEEIAHAKRALEGSFRPLVCKAEDWDYKAKMRFKVLDEKGETILEIPELVRGDIVNEARFAELIEIARNAVRAKGYALAALDRRS